MSTQPLNRETCQAVLIAGPTASGKSGVALNLAEHLGGTVINADSMQVYADLHLLTARPGAQDTQRIPHLLYGTVSGSTAYSTGQWLHDVRGMLPALREKGTLPIFAGGTGLYFKALLEGLSPVPEIPDDIRRRWRVERTGIPSQELHAILAQRDPSAALTLAPGDRQRIVRALEVLDATGRPLTEWQKQPGVPVIAPSQTLKIHLSPERTALYARCDARFNKMMREGALHEVTNLLAENLSPDLPVMRALGVRPLSDHLRGNLSFEKAVTQAKTETRRYAKRQLTWARGQMTAWHWLETQNREDLTQQILNFLAL